jgi:zinc transport system substrate-binding protein
MRIVIVSLVRALSAVGACALLAVLATACGASSASTGRGETNVVAAFYPLAFAAKRVGAAAVAVTNLTPPGAEPHDIELTPKEVARIQKADLVLYLSHDFQPAVEQAVKGARGQAIDALAGMHLRAGADEEQGTTDPHVWLDPVLFARFVGRIGAALDRPTAATRLAAQIRRLDREYRAGLAHCTRRELVTSHAAFGYLAARYRLQQIPIGGLDPEAEPSPKRLASLVALVRREHVTTVFFETLVSPKVAETVAREAGVKTAVLDPIEGLTPDEVSHGDDYLSVMRRNLAALRKALGCR